MSRSVPWPVVVLVAVSLWPILESVPPQDASFLAANEPDAAAQQRIESALDATAEVEFHETPLSEVVGFLRETYKIPVVINNRALDDVGLGTETPVTMSLRGISLRSLLHLMLKELDLTYVIRNQVLMITTPEEAESRLASRVYPVSDLAIDVPPPLVVGSLPSRFDTVKNLLQEIVAPDSWDYVGGSSQC